MKFRFTAKLHCPKPLPSITIPAATMAKKDKKKSKAQDDYWDTEFQDDAAVVAPPATEDAKPAVEETTADDLADDFGGLMSAIKKTGKGKKGKKQQVEMVDANEELEALAEEKPDTPTNGAVKEEKEEEDGEFR